MLLYICVFISWFEIDASILFSNQFLNLFSFSGLHHKKSCNSKDTLNKIKGILERNKDYLFSDQIEIYDRRSTVNVKANGGWGDSRDHELCMRYSHGNEPL